MAFVMTIIMYWRKNMSQADDLDDLERKTDQNFKEEQKQYQPKEEHPVADAVTGTLDSTINTMANVTDINSTSKLLRYILGKFTHGLKTSRLYQGNTKEKEKKQTKQGKDTDKIEQDAQGNNVENMANEHVAVNAGQSVGIDPLAPQAKPSVPAVSPEEVQENTDAMKAPEGYTFVVTNSPEFKVTDLVKDGQQKPVTNTAGEKVSNEVTGCENLYYHIIDKASADKIKAMNDKDATGVEIVGDDLNKAIPNTPDQKQHNVKEIQEKRLAEIKRKQEEKLRLEAEKKKKEEEKKKQREKEKTRGSGLKR